MQRAVCRMLIDAVQRKGCCVHWADDVVSDRRAKLNEIRVRFPQGSLC